MRFSTTLVTLLPVAGALAAVQTVTVGDGSKLLFDPPSVTAAVGDTIKFEFKSKNHSVTQSTFDAPCVFKANGVDSGFQLTPPNATSFASWSFEVQATDPTWWFCAQTAPAVHCTAGMVFAVNPTADKTFDMFKAAAMGGGGATSAGSGTTTNSTSSGAATATGATGASDGSGATGATSATGATGSASSGAATTTGSSTAAAESGTAAAASNAGSVMSGNSVALLSMASLVLGLTL